VEDRRRPDDRMAGERKLGDQVEDPGLDGAGVAGGPEKDGLEMPKLLGDAQHLVRSQVARIQEDRQAVAAERGSTEDVDVTVGQVHLATVDTSVS
jgi:hypothetical protein